MVDRTIAEHVLKSAQEMHSGSLDELNFALLLQTALKSIADKFPFLPKVDYLDYVFVDDVNGRNKLAFKTDLWKRHFLADRSNAT